MKIAELNQMLEELEKTFVNANFVRNNDHITIGRVYPNMNSVILQSNGLTYEILFGNDLSIEGSRAVVNDQYKSITGN